MGGELVALNHQVPGPMKTIRTKRIYAPPEPADGTRILVDRLWPRGVARDEACINAWIKDIAPSDGLRRWYSHDSKKWSEFRTRYLAELTQNKAAAELYDIAREATTITLLYAAKDIARNN